MTDILVIGGGVIGLSITYELLNRGLKVTLLERGPLASEASWAGAGMLPYSQQRPDSPPVDQLRAASATLWPEWVQTIEQITHFSSEYVTSGMLEVRESQSPAQFEAEQSHWKEQGVETVECNAADMATKFPFISTSRISPVQPAYYQPQFAHVRNPRHLKNLTTACLSLGATIIEHSPVEQFVFNGERLQQVKSACGLFAADQFVLATGAWSGQLSSQFSSSSPHLPQLPIAPVKGQLVLLKLPSKQFAPVIQQGLRYVVPRLDGHVLVGSTEEHTGFDKSSSADGVANLLQFAISLVPQLKEAELVTHWAGLRPHAPAGIPFLGQWPGIHNLMVACGHYRNGLQMSPITAHLIAQLAIGEQPEFDLAPYSPARTITH
jgi:glycine oxidase